MKTIGIVIAIVCLVPLIAWGDVVTPIPEPPYAIIGTVAGYTSYDVHSSRGLRGILRRPASSEDCTHGISYFGPGRVRRIRLEVEEVHRDSNWLAHDVERHVRTVSTQAPHLLEVRSLGGNNVIYLQQGRGGEYFWVSGGDKAVHIDWNRIIDAEDGSDSIEELPAEFLTTYLQQLPSDLPTFQFDEAQTRQFIRDEIDEQFYYTDRTVQQLRDVSDPQQRVGLVGDVDGWLDKVAKLRAKYFGGPTATEWAHAILARFDGEQPGRDPKELDAQPQVESRVNDLKQWWAAHRDDPAVLPTPTATAPPRTPTGTP